MPSPTTSVACEPASTAVPVGEHAPFAPTSVNLRRPESAPLAPSKASASVP